MDFSFIHQDTFYLQMGAITVAAIVGGVIIRVMGRRNNKKSKD